MRWFAGPVRHAIRHHGSVDEPEDGTAEEDHDEDSPPGRSDVARWPRTVDRAGAALVVVGCLGVASWGWTVARTQYEVSRSVLYPFLGRDGGLSDRIDLFATQVPALLSAGLVAGIGIALRSFATTRSDDLRSGRGPVLGRPFPHLLVGTVIALGALLLGAMALGEDDDEGDGSELGVDRSFDEDEVGVDRPGLTFDLGPDETITTVAPEPTHTLEVHTDGCGVIRSGEVGEDLTWVVKDLDGFQVLGRVASGETRYRYFRPGTYTVVLEGPARSVVSNEVTITC
jgi:hypothetical protein